MASLRLECTKCLERKTASESVECTIEGCPMPKVLPWEFLWVHSQEWRSNPDSNWCRDIETAEHDWTTRLEFATTTARVTVVCCGFCDEMRVVTERGLWDRVFQKVT